MQRSLLQKFARVAACGIVLLSVTNVLGVTLNFDDLGTGTNVTNQYAGTGIVFATPGFDVLNNTFGGVVFTPSGSNYLAVTGNGTFNFMIGAAPGTVDFFSFSTLGLLNSFGFYDGATIGAYDSNGNLITSTTVNPIGLFQAQSPGIVSLTGPGIHEVRFTHINNSSGGLFGVDDLTFPEVTPTSEAPEPTSIALFAIGLIGFGVRRSFASTTAIIEAKRNNLHLSA
jgi:PEP-CTERM motif-containing protein